MKRLALVMFMAAAVLGMADAQGIDKSLYAEIDLFSYLVEGRKEGKEYPVKYKMALNFWAQHGTSVYFADAVGDNFVASTAKRWTFGRGQPVVVYFSALHSQYGIWLEVQIDDIETVMVLAEQGGGTVLSYAVTEPKSARTPPEIEPGPRRAAEQHTARQPAPPVSVKVTPCMPDTRANRLYRIQLGAFINSANAGRLFERLRAAGFRPVYERHGAYQRVLIPGVRAADMASVIQRLGSAGFSTAWLREEP
jgi:hypothetical protein